MLKNIVALLLLTVVSCGKKDATDHTGHMMNDNLTSGQIIQLMHAPMMTEAFQVTSNPDIDFLANMIPHHMGAVLSSQELLKYATNQVVITLASNIITAQNTEIDEFSNLIASMQSETDYNQAMVEQFSAYSQTIMANMMTAMNEVELTDNPERDFLGAMIAHHQGAITVSQELLKISTNTTVREIAQRIISDQEKEIKEIKNMLAAY